MFLPSQDNTPLMYVVQQGLGIGKATFVAHVEEYLFLMALERLSNPQCETPQIPE